MSMRFKSGYRWLILSMGWLIYFCFGLINTAVAPLVAPIMLDLSLSYTQMGVIAGAWQLVYIFTAQPLGLLIDRLGVYRSLLLGGVIISASSLLRALTSGFWGLFASVALFGVGGPLVSIGTPKLISVWFSGAERGTASGINASASAVGSMAALALTNSLALPALGEWRAVFLGYGALSVAVTAIWLLLGRRSSSLENKANSSPLGAGQRGEVRYLLRHRNVWILVGIGVAAFLTNHALKNWLPRVLELKGLSPVDAGYATSVLALSGILGSLTIPRLSYRMRSRRLMIALILLVSGASILAIGMGAGGSLWAGLVCTGFLMRSLMPLLLLMLMEMPEVGAERMGAVGGLFFSLGEIGGFLGPFMMGYMRDLTGSFLFGIYSLTVITEAAILGLALMKSSSD
jgi:CP family cyanate transporter-like MFS transporter